MPNLTSLSQRTRDILDGDKGLSSPLAGIAQRVLLGTRLHEVTGLQDKVTAAGAENTDVVVPLQVLGGTADAGTWTKAITSAGVRTVTRTAAAALQGYWLEAPQRYRTSSGKGLKVTGVRVEYNTATAIQTDVRVEVYKRTMSANGAAPGAPTLIGGDQNAHYDTAHDTAAERNSVADHTAVVTLPTPAYLAANEEILVKFVVDGSATGVTLLRDCHLLCSETLVDLA